MKILFVLSQITQNFKPFSYMLNDARFNMSIVSCSGKEPALWQGDEYINKQVFTHDTPTDLPIKILKNISLRPSLAKFWGLINPQLFSLALKSQCSVVYGHAYASFWIVIVVSKLSGKKLILTNDSTRLTSNSKIKNFCKCLFYKFLYNFLSDAVLVPSTKAKEFLELLGIKKEKIELTPYVVDNDEIAELANKRTRQQVRASFQISPEVPLIMFCAKLIARKRPLDALRAFAKAAIVDSVLLVVGEGPLKAEMLQEAETLHITNKVRFAGLIAYQDLPAVYAASDLLLHTAEQEPYGLIVNEAMVCGLPVIVSDRVGAGFDLVEEGKTGYIYPCGEIGILSDLIRQCLQQCEKLGKMREACKERMQSWSAKENALAHMRVLERVLGI